MSKRKAEESTDDPMVDDSDNSQDEDEEIVDVDFDFFDLDPIDFHAVKRLLGQLFSADAELLNLTDIADLIINQASVGSTVKVDGKESDPYALLTVINTNVHKENPSVKAAVEYLMSKCPMKDVALRGQVAQVLQPHEPNQGHDAALVISERFLNMPVQIMPPMYKMLMEEMAKTNATNGGFDFEWYIFISKTYKEVPSTVDEEGEQLEAPVAPKKKKAKKQAQEMDLMYFQSEDEIIAEYADIQYDFKLTNADKEASSDARRAFTDYGIAPGRKVMMVKGSKMKAMIEALEEACAI
ncbi:p21-C-terminal region-binding protein-domain-containing protein [Umbelopsis sp. PMI_123]|nr:p21-C-terminal region-binding protein-domain-containing protein [Umbelopsis sp. PMI_123]